MVAMVDGGCGSGCSTHLARYFLLCALQLGVLVVQLLDAGFLRLLLLLLKVELTFKPVKPIPIIPHVTRVRTGSEHICLPLGQMPVDLSAAAEIVHAVAKSRVQA